MNSMRSSTILKAIGQLTALALVVCLLSRCPLFADDTQPNKELTPEQKEKLKERESVRKQAELAFDKGKNDEGVRLAEKVVALTREVFGDIHAEVATEVARLAYVHEQAEHFNAAKKARQEVLEIHSKLHGKNHWETTDARLAVELVDKLTGLTPEERKQLAEAASTNAEVFRLSEQGQASRAIPLAEKCLEVRKTLLGEKHPYYAVDLYNLARLYQSQGDYGKAELLFKQVLPIYREVLGEKHPHYAADLYDLARLYLSQGDYSKAEPLFKQALQIYKQVLGEKHPDYVACLNNLGLLYIERGDYSKADPLCKQALEIIKQTVGKKDLRYVACLNNLALLYIDQGDYSKAEPLYKQALEIMRQVAGEKHPHYAFCLNNLANLYRTLGDYSRAEPLAVQALEIRQHVPGEKHPDYATSLSSLAGIYEAQGDYRRAEALVKQALDIRRQVLSEKDPNYANSLEWLAGLYHSQGDFSRAEPLFIQALEIRKQVLGEKHPNYAISQCNLASVYYSQGDCSKAEPLLRLGLGIVEQHWQDDLSTLSERQRLRFLDSLRHRLAAYLSVAPSAGVGCGELYAHALLWKGAVAARQAEDRTLRDQPELKDLVARLHQVHSRLSRLAFRTPSPQRHDAWVKQLDELRDQKEDLESELGRKSQAFRKEQDRQHLSAADVVKVLAKDAVFVDFLEYSHASPPKGSAGKLEFERRFLAFIVGSDRKLVMLELKAAAPIEKAVQSWRQALDKGDTKALEAAAADLHERVWKPLLPHLQGAKTVLIAPDGEFARFPFAALPGQKPGTYLLEDVSIGYVVSGRQVVEMFDENVPKFKTDGLLALGGVDYNADPGKSKLDEGSKPPQIGDKDRSGFAFLPGTEREAKTCRELFLSVYPETPKDRALLLLKDEPSKSRVKQELARKWRYVHLATHGFFESPARIAALRAGLKFEERGLSAFQQHDEDMALALNPLLRCGVVLAGAAREARNDESDTDDGILTAEEVALLDLRGTELVVLSACDTGLGSVEKGQGVIGLQRAFQEAGARALATSLWKVDDAATTILMEEFYTNLWKKGLPKLEALRQAQLTVLRSPERIAKLQKTLRDLGLNVEELPDGGKISGRTHPKLWAAFLLSGDVR